jgi:single-strand selective monofunctional uracil DNA glycosylase
MHEFDDRRKARVLLGSPPTMSLSRISRELARKVDALAFGRPVACVYNPLDYAREPHERYLERWGRGRKRVLLVGMNPGPFGMVQTGVPFGDIAQVRDFLGVEGKVKRPAREHPKRPVLGFDCPRGEVSGARLWGWASSRFGTPERFFREFFVANYCPLAFLEESGKNRTPDKLPEAERRALFEACDAALRRIAVALEPDHVIGIGAFATARVREALPDAPSVGTILHPSPASPKANKNWAEQIERQLEASGIRLPGR